MRIYALCTLLLLSACQYHAVSQGESIYKNSDNGQTLVVPPPLSTEDLDHYYELPMPQQGPLPPLRIFPSAY